MIPVQFIAPLLYGYEYWQLEANNNILAKIDRGRAAYLQWCVVARLLVTPNQQLLMYFSILLIISVVEISEV